MSLIVLLCKPRLPKHPAVAWDMVHRLPIAYMNVWCLVMYDILSQPASFAVNC
jgi:hypothetical protein